jgi:hypothetical protein
VNCFGGARLNRRAFLIEAKLSSDKRATRLQLLHLAPLAFNGDSNHAFDFGADNSDRTPALTVTSAESLEVIIGCCYEEFAALEVTHSSSQAQSSPVARKSG